MKTTRKLNLSELNKNETKDSRGGYKVIGDETHACGCGCYWAGAGGSSVENNRDANFDGNLASPLQ